MIVTGGLHKDGWRFGRPFDVIDQCMQFTSDMMNIKRLSTDGAITIEDGKAVIDQNTCVLCKVCLEACPVGALALMQETSAQTAAADHKGYWVFAEMQNGQPLDVGLELTSKACELAQTMNDLDAIADELRSYTEKVEASFVVDKLDYLVKGGRCSSAAALGANLLNLKPCIEVKDGKMSVVKKYRGNYNKCLTSYAKERLEGREDIDHSSIFVVKTVVSDDCYNSVMESVNAHGHFETIYEEVAGCTISCHCGPGTLGIVFVRK